MFLNFLLRLLTQPPSYPRGQMRQTAALTTTAAVLPFCLPLKRQIQSRKMEMDPMDEFSLEYWK